MPIVAGIGGNSGNQTITMIVRALALGQIQGGYWAKLLGKEIGVALLNGVVWGTLLGVIAYAFYGNVALGGVMALAMILNLVLAALHGGGDPWLRARFGRDPAVGSSVLITAVTDSGGFFIFLGLATLFPASRPLERCSRAAASVASISAAPCAAETKPASYADGARYTPRSSMAWKKRLKRSLSHCMTSAKLLGGAARK